MGSQASPIDVPGPPGAAHEHHTGPIAPTPCRGPTRPRRHSGTFDTTDLKGLPVRDLLTELAAVEARLRTLPFLVTRQGSTGVNPEVARLLSRQRTIVEQLRRRRVSWTASATPREPSAAWPPPPWS